jgi:flagellar M-ring protein FliF
MVFDETAVPEVVEAGLMDRLQLDVGRLIQTAILAVVALIIAFGLLRPLIRGTAAGAASADTDVALPYMPGPAGAMGPDVDDDLPIGDDLPPIDLDNLPSFPQVALPGLDNGFDTGESFDVDPVTRLKRLIEEREEETVDILRSWMDEDEEDQLQ